MTIPDLGLVDLTGSGQPSADVPLVVLGPGIGTSVNNLYGRLVPLLGGVRAVGWDLPGHGVSRPARDFSVAELAEAVLRAAEQVSDAPFHYVGTSIGGAVGQVLLAGHPQRLASLTLIATTDYFPHPAGWGQRADLVARAGTPTQVIDSAKLWFAPGFLERDAQTATALLHDLQGADRFGYAAACRALGGFDLRGARPRAEVPTLALAGEHDVVTDPQTVRRLAEKLGARFETVPDASHLLAAEAPGRTAELITELVGAGPMTRHATETTTRRRP